MFPSKHFPNTFSTTRILPSNRIGGPPGHSSLVATRGAPGSHFRGEDRGVGALPRGGAGRALHLGRVQPRPGLPRRPTVRRFTVRLRWGGVRRWRSEGGDFGGGGLEAGGERRGFRQVWVLGSGFGFCCVGLIQRIGA